MPRKKSGQFDLLIVGAGPVGCVIAERAAHIKGWRSLIIDKRDHIAGNCFDPLHSSGLRIHRYGPHYFRTNNTQVLKYLSRFTEWIPGNYKVQALYNGQLYPFPINLATLEHFYGRSFNHKTAREFLKSIRSKIKAPKNSEEFVLSRVGPGLYKAFYLNYTRKQWGQSPKALAPSVCGRIPIRLDRDDRYFDQANQLTPKNGFTALFQKMTSDDLIQIKLNTDYRDIQNSLFPRKATVYCGPIDEYFDFRLGKLPWRSLDFKFKLYKQEWKQPCVQINYPNDFKFTRTVEIKHVTQQKHRHTILSYEYPRAHGEPYYPVPSDSSQKIYEQYRELAQQETRQKNIFFSGRLATYRYINTDEAVEGALATFDQICQQVDEQKLCL